MLNELTRPSIQQFISDHESDDVRTLVLNNSLIEGIPASVIANQIACRRKAKEKLPLWYSAKGIVYPSALTLEQSSSQVTAQYKAQVMAKLLSERNRCADLSGGFGVDSLFLSQVCTELHYADPNAELLEIARHNHRILGASNLGYHGVDAETFLDTDLQKFNLIYLDPSRRSDSKSKAIRLSDYKPDVLTLMPKLFEKTNLVLIKTSPLLDIQQGLKQLRAVSAVWVVSVDNDCKEVLYLCRAGFSGEPTVQAVNLGREKQETRFTVSQEKASSVKFSEPLAYLYEPNASLLKAGAFKLVSNLFGLFKLHPNTHLYTSATLQTDFPGRIFSVIGTTRPKTVKSDFPTGKANVIVRNYPLTPNELKQKLRLLDGGENYLIATTTSSGKMLLACRRIK